MLSYILHRPKMRVARKSASWSLFNSYQPRWQLRHLRTITVQARFITMQAPLSSCFELIFKREGNLLRFVHVLLLGLATYRFLPHIADSIRRICTNAGCSAFPKTISPWPNIEHGVA